MKHYDRMHSVLADNYSGFENVDVPLDLFMRALVKDKKNIGKGSVTLILPDKEAVIKKDSYKNDDNLVTLCKKYLTEVRS